LIMRYNTFYDITVRTLKKGITTNISTNYGKKNRAKTE
jgi:hypothetical protein